VIEPRIVGGRVRDLAAGRRGRGADPPLGAERPTLAVVGERLLEVQLPWSAAAADAVEAGLAAGAHVAVLAELAVRDRLDAAAVGRLVAGREDALGRLRARLEASGAPAERVA